MPFKKIAMTASSAAISWIVFLYPGVMASNAQQIRSYARRQAHVSADTVLSMQCFGFTARTDQLETISCDDNDAEEYRQQTELNEKMTLMCVNRYSTASFIRKLSEDELSFLKSAINAVNRCQSMYVQYDDNCNYGGMVKSRNIQLNYWDQIIYVIKNAENRLKTLDATKALMELTSRLPALERMTEPSEAEVENSTTDTISSDEMIDSMLDAWKESSFKKMDEQFNEEHKFKVPDLTKADICK